MASSQWVVAVRAWGKFVVSPGRAAGQRAAPGGLGGRSREGTAGYVTEGAGEKGRGIGVSDGCVGVDQTRGEGRV